MTFKATPHHQFNIHLVSPNIGEHNDLMGDIEQQFNCVVTHFDTPEATFTAERPNLIILDMANRQDIEFVECLKTCFQAPIIVLSDRPSMAMAVNVMRAGGCDFFPKPVSKNALLKRLKTLSVGQPLTNHMALNAQSTNVITPFAEQERQIIEDALGAFHGNITQAAAALQISPSTIYRKKQGWEHPQSN